MKGRPGSCRPGSYTTPSWPAPDSVIALFTRREGGVSTGPWSDGRGGGGLNLGGECGDEQQRVAENRRRIGEQVGLPIRWLAQVHGARVVEVTAATGAPEVADAQVTTVRGIALAVLVADCLPVLLVDRAGTIVGAAHAGWRGLAAGVLENTVAVMRARRPEAELLACLGPRIGPTAFEVGDDVLQAFAAQDPDAAAYFAATGNSGKWLADLAGLAARRLARMGLSSITAVDACTWSDHESFWSYRRDRVCGRMAGIIGLRPR